MTVSSELNEQSYVSQGVASETFPTVFPYVENSDVQVSFDGTIQVEGVNYTIAGGGGAPGTVTWIGTPTAAKTVKLIRRRPAIQTNEYAENDAFPAEAHERTVDRLAMAIAAALRLRLTNAQEWDAVNKKIANLLDPTVAQDAATKAYVDSKATIAQVPSPGAGDVDKYLKATGAGASGWFFPREVPSPGAGDVGEFLKATGVGAYSFEPLVTPVNLPPENWLINGDFQVCQRHAVGGTFSSTSTFPNNDGAYLLDRWVLASNGNNIVQVTHEGTVVPNGAARSCKMAVQIANQKFGIFQPLDNHTTKQILKDGTSTVVSLQFKARTEAGTPILNIRAALLPWTGAVDLPLKDPVSGASWGAAGTNPTLAAGYTYENTPANIAVAQGSWGTHLIENILVDTVGVNNLGVFIWVDDDNAAVGDLLYLADIGLNVGSTASSFLRRPFHTELTTCQRYFHKTFVATVEPKQASGGTTGALARRIETTGVANRGVMHTFPVPMRISPTITFYNPIAANALWRNNTDVADSGAAATGVLAQQSVFVEHTQVAGDTGGATGDFCIIHLTADAEFGA